MFIPSTYASYAEKFYQTCKAGSFFVRILVPPRRPLKLKNEGKTKQRKVRCVRDSSPVGASKFLQQKLISQLKSDENGNKKEFVEGEEKRGKGKNSRRG